MLWVEKANQVVFLYPFSPFSYNLSQLPFFFPFFSLWGSFSLKKKKPLLCPVHKNGCNCKKRRQKFKVFASTSPRLSVFQNEEEETFKLKFFKAVKHLFRHINSLSLYYVVQVKGTDLHRLLARRLFKQSAAVFFLLALGKMVPSRCWVRWSCSFSFHCSTDKEAEDPFDLLLPKKAEQKKQQRSWIQLV